MSLILFLFSFILLQNDSLKQNENEHVKLISKISTDSVKSGKTFSISFKFNPSDKIKINSEPEIEFHLEINNLIKFESQSLPKVDSLGYIKTESEIIFNFQARENIKQANTKIIGTLVYYYCSQNEGWCSKYKQKIEFPITITK